MDYVLNYLDFVRLRLGIILLFNFNVYIKFKIDMKNIYKTNDTYFPVHSILNRKYGC